MRATFLLSALVGLLALSLPVRAEEGPVPTFPPGQDFKSPKPARRVAGGLTPWKTVVVRDDAPAYKSFEGDPPLGAAKLKFGELAHVVATWQAPGKPPRLLLARFDESVKFQGWIGWVDGSSVLDRSQPLKVNDAREDLQKAVAKDHPLYERIQQALPDASPWFVTLKAITPPYRGKACFSRPVSPAEYERMARTTDAVALPPFAFVYVYGFAVDARNVYCLVGPHPEIAMEPDNLGDKFRQQLTGWVDFESLVLWTTRQAFEFHLEKPALEHRRKSNRPIELFSRKIDLLDRAKGEMAGGKGGKPVFVEDLDPERAPPHMCMPWDPRVMRFPILSRFPLRDPAKKSAAIHGQREGFQLGVFGATKVGGSVYDIEAMKRKMSNAVMDLRDFELVLVLDATGSNRPAIDALKDAVVKVVEELKKEAAGQKDELEKIQLRVAVVLYKDFPDQDADYLTKESDDFFDVMTDKGLTDFKEWIDTQVRDAGGGDELEEPFEGIRAAMKKFLALEGSQHAPGAARMLLVMGDSGNHDVGGNTKLSLEDVAKLLQPVGEVVIDRQKKQAAKVQLHSVMTLWTEDDVKKERVGQKKWEEQIHALADKTGGSRHEVAFHNDAAKKASTDKLAAVLKSAVDARRSLMRAELVRIRDLFGVTAGGEVAGAGGAEQVLARDRLKEVIRGKDELEKLLKGLSRTYFTEVFAVGQAPGEPEELPRLKLCILVSDREFLKLLTSTQSMAEGLDEIVKKGGLGGLGGSGDAVAAKIKRLIVVTMLVALGEEVTPGRIEALMKKPLRKIQEEEVSQLPVPFGILKTQPKTEEDLKKLVEALKAKADRLLKINAYDRARRLFPAGVATGEQYIWLYESELP